MPQKIVSSTSIKQGTQGASLIAGTTWDVRDVWKEMMLVEAVQTPFVNYLFLNERVKQVTTNNAGGLFEFPERELVPNIDTISVATAGGSATITITPGEINLYHVGKSIQFTSTMETGVVTTKGASTIVVTRDLDTSAAAQNWSTVTAGVDKIKLLGEAMGDLDSVPKGVFANPYMRKSRVQLFEKEMSMSDMQVASTTHGGDYGGDWWEHYMYDTAKVMKRDISNAFWCNQNHQLLPSTTYGSTNQIITKTEGIIYQILNNSGFKLNYGPGALTKPVLDAFFRMSKRGSVHKTFWVSDSLMNQIEDLIALKYYNTESVTRYGPIKGDNVIKVITIRTANLIVDVIREPMLEEGLDGTGVLLDDDHVYNCSYVADKKGSRKWRLEQLIQANGNPIEQALYLSHVGVGIACAPYHGILTNNTALVSTT